MTRIKSNLKQIIIEKELNTGKRLTIDNLAMQTGISRPTLFNLYHNKATSFRKVHLEIICELLGIELKDLLISEVVEQFEILEKQNKESKKYGWHKNYMELNKEYMELEKQAKKDRAMLEKVVKQFNESWALIDDDEDMPLPFADIVLVLQDAKLYVEESDEGIN